MHFHDILFEIGIILLISW